MKDFLDIYVTSSCACYVEVSRQILESPATEVVGNLNAREWGDHNIRLHTEQIFDKFTHAVNNGILH